MAPAAGSHAESRPALRRDEDREAGDAQSRSRISPPPTSTPAAWTPTPTTSARASAWRGARPARSTWCAAATASSTAARRRSCWARRTRTTASTSSPTRSRARRCRRIRIASRRIPAGGAAQRPSILVVDKDFQNPRLQQASVGVDYEVMANTSLSVSYLFVKGDSAPALDRSQPRAARIGDLHGGGHERDASRITASARRRRGRSRTSTA